MALAAVVHALALKAFYCFEEISAQLSPAKADFAEGCRRLDGARFWKKPRKIGARKLPGNADGLFAWRLDHAGASPHQNEQDFLLVVRPFMPECGFVWLLTELDPEQPDIAFGLCDLGMGCPELDSVSLSEIELAAEVSGTAVERDPAFIPAKSISVYADDARERGLVEV